MENIFKRLFQKPGGEPESEIERLLHQRLDGMARNGIFFSLESGEAEAAKSRFGGRPLLPAQTEWPHYTTPSGECVALSFLLQLSCEELAPFDLEGALPRQGRFYLFYDLAGQPWQKSEGVCLLYDNTPDEQLSLREFPDTLPPERQLTEKKLIFESRATIPDWEGYAALCDDFDAADAEWDIVERKQAEWGYQPVKSIGRLLGYASLKQGDIASVCESRAQGDKPAYSIESAKAWRLLLQLDSHDDLLVGDCGSLYFYIRQTDLEQREFGRVEFEMQSY